MEILNSRETRAIISLGAYQNNLLYFINRNAPVRVAPVIKANGYGHGAIPLAKVAAELRCLYLCVAFLEEALELRNAGINLPILVLNYFSPRATSLFIQNELTATIYATAQLESTLPFLSSGRLKVHLKIDTGMSRLGVRPEEAEDLIRRIMRIKAMDLEGAYTHFATADEPDNRFTQNQYDRFSEFRTRYRSAIRYFHISNSAAAQYLPLDLFDFIRLGISSYGLDPRNVKRQDSLLPVLSWETVLSHVKTVREGESVSYGRTFTAERPMVIGTVPVGYADGYNRLLSNRNRLLSNRGAVLVKGRRCPIVGRICMDQFMVDLSSIPSPSAGDPVKLIGFDGSEEISCEEIARSLSTINYEVTCQISKRVPRVYTNEKTKP